MSSSDEHEKHLNGEKLYGDDMSYDEMADWYRSEEEGYSGLVLGREHAYEYEYHALNKYHFYSRVATGSAFDHVLGIGSAYGEEFRPILDKIKDLVILDPSDVFAGAPSMGKFPCKYVKPVASGKMPFDDNSFDLVTCFGVIHHIPNVTYVMNEICRCLKPGGTLLIREPIVSQGDWRHPRNGVTKNERGIPVTIFDDIVKGCGFKVIYRRYWNFQPFPILARVLGVKLYNSRFLVWLDDLISNLFPWPLRYHRTRLFQKFAPAAIVYIVTK